MKFKSNPGPYYGAVRILDGIPANEHDEGRDLSETISAARTLVDTRLRENELLRFWYELIDRYAGLGYNDISKGIFEAKDMRLAADLWLEEHTGEGRLLK